MSPNVCPVRTAACGHSKEAVLQKLITGLFATAALCLIPQKAHASDYFDDASNDQIIMVFHELNVKCRGGAGDVTWAWCGTRDLLGKYMLKKRNLCYGKKTDDSNLESHWHTCGKDSIR